MDPSEAKKVEESYEYLESYLASSKYVAGDVLSVADFSVVATLSTIEVMVPIASVHKKLLGWYKRMKSLPYYEAGNQAGLDKLKRLVDDIEG